MCTGKRRLMVWGMAVVLLAGAWGLGDAARPAVAQVDPAELFQQQIDAGNRGDVDAAMETFADDAVVGGVPQCVPVECVGKDAIRNMWQYLVADNTGIIITSSEVSGNTATGSAEVESDGIRAAGVDRILGGFSVEVSGDKISDQRFIADLTDPQTADWVASLGANSVTVDLGPGRDADQSPGTALLIGSPNKTSVLVTITPGPAGVPQPISIHEGTCAGLGAVALSLQDIGGGKSNTILDVSLSGLQTGNYAIAVQKSHDEPDVFVACGDIPAAAPVPPPVEPAPAPEAAPAIAPTTGSGGLLPEEDRGIATWWYALAAIGALLVVAGLAKARSPR